MSYRFLSICSGIEAASVAFKPLGWTPVAFSEIEAFPSAVLKHHYPETPNLGDMTKFMDWPEDLLAQVDVICGGTPCQAFSVAGKRESLNDTRGNLTLTFIQLCNHVQRIRETRNLPAPVILWENVPGVLNTKDNAFGCFLGGLAGEEEPLVPAGDKWTHAGCVFGPERTLVWRILDAQYFGLAQRRQRVFVVGCSGDGAGIPEILLECEGLRRDTPPSREKREGVAVCPTLRAGGNNTGGDRPPGTDVDTCESLVPVGYRVHGDKSTAMTGNGVANVADPVETARCLDSCGGYANGQGGNVVAQPVLSKGQWPADLAPTLNAAFGDKQGLEDQHALSGAGLFVPAVLSSGQANASVTKNITGALDCIHEAPIIVGALTAKGPEAYGAPEVDAGHYLVTSVREVADTLRSGSTNPASHGKVNGTDRMTLIPTAFTCKDHEGDASTELSPTLRSGGHHNSHANAGVMPAVAFEPRYYLRDNKTGGKPSDTVCLKADAAKAGDSSPHVAVAFQTSQSGVRVGEVHATLDSNNGSRRHNGVLAFAIQDGREIQKSQNGLGVSDSGVGYTVDTTGAQAVAFSETGPGWISEGIGTIRAEGENRPSRPCHTVLAPALTASNNPSRSPQSQEVANQVAAVAAATTAVRRLLPEECESLQGFSRGYTAIPWRGKPPEDCPDGPRYKALGNSWAVPCVAWIGRRIDTFLKGGTNP